ncbi:MAG: ABC transporter ATP-binding protein [Anaerolineae bacterium]|nr:ABC transporter ATP-binding protein [Anaerolineae bacterium]
MHAIHTTDLCKQFKETRAVNDLSLRVQEGEVFGFLGHNGAGKTTTIRLLNGVLEPTSGRAQVLGLSPYSQGEDLRQQTGVLTETPALDERLTAVQNLAIFADLYGVPRNEVKKRVDDMLGQFDLADRGGEKVGGYSKGMKQRLAIARAFLHRPRLIFLDEPTSSLDPISSRGVHDMIRHISQEQGATVFLCTHNLLEAQRLCKRVAVLEKGHLVAIGTPHELGTQVGMALRYQLEVSENTLQTAQSVLSGVAGIFDMTIDNHHITFSIPQRETVADMMTMLINHGVRVYGLVAQEATLEDIYFALHGEGDAS